MNEDVANLAFSTVQTSGLLCSVCEVEQVACPPASICTWFHRAAAAIWTTNYLLRLTCSALLVGLAIVRSFVRVGRNVFS